jgi:hypothetical protein
VTVDSDQDRLMVAFNTVPACLWVGGDPDFSLYAISEGLAVMTGECPVHGHHQDVVLSLPKASCTPSRGVGPRAARPAARQSRLPGPERAMLADYRAARVAPSGGLRWSGSARCRATRMASL